MLLDILKSDLKQATLDKDITRIRTIRLLLSSIHNKEIELRGIKKELTEEDVLSVLQKEAKQRRESIVEFKKGGRTDLVGKESAELQIIERYLPDQAGEEEVRGLVEKAIKETEASSMRDMGKVMSIVMAQLKGRVDGKTVSGIVKDLLK